MIGSQVAIRGIWRQLLASVCKRIRNWGQAAHNFSRIRLLRSLLIVWTWMLMMRIVCLNQIISCWEQLKFLSALKGFKRTFQNPSMKSKNHYLHAQAPSFLHVIKFSFLYGPQMPNHYLQGFPLGFLQEIKTKLWANWFMFAQVRSQFLKSRAVSQELLILT